MCVGNLIIIGLDNGLSPDRRQAIIWTNDGILLIGPLGTNFSEISIEILTFSFKKLRLKVSSAKRRPFCLGLNVLNRGMCNSHLGVYRVTHLKCVQISFNTHICMSALQDMACHYATSYKISTVFKCRKISPYPVSHLGDVIRYLQMCQGALERQGSLEGHMFYFVVSTVSVDVLALSDHRHTQ